MSFQSKISDLAGRVGQEIKTVRNQFLSKTNTASYTPTANYHPATKKYVDDNDVHNHNGTYEPVFSKNSAFNKNFGSAAGTVCQGNDSRLNNQRVPTDNSVVYTKIGGDLKSYQTLTPDANGDVTIDWTTGGIFRIELTSSGVLSHTHLQLNKVITLVVSGDYSLNIGFGVIAIIISGEYDGSTTNYLQMHYIGNNNFLSMNEFLIAISQS